MTRRRGAKKLVNVREYAGKHRGAFIQCRLWGHSWHPSGAIVVENGSVKIPLRCDRCDTKRTDVAAKSGDLEKRGYKTTKGYLWEGVGQQKPTIGELRAAFIEQVMRRRT
jgi:hypothetical protein